MRGTDFPVWVDGAAAPDARIALNLHDPALNAGAGLFETLLVLRGHAPLLERHLARLLASACALGFPSPPDAALLRAEANSVASCMPGGEGLLRVLLLQDDQRTRRALLTEALPSDRMAPVKTALAAAEFQGPRPMAAHKTLNNLQSRLAQMDGARRGLDEVLLCLPDGTLLEGTRSSIFMVKGGVLHTPALSWPILPGITREVLLELARNEGIPCVEGRCSVQAFAEADEAFLSASVRGVRAVALWEGKAPDKIDGPVTRRLRAAYAAFLGPCRSGPSAGKSGAPAGGTLR